MHPNHFLKTQLENRIKSVLASTYGNFHNDIKIFLDFVESNAVLRALLEELKTVEFNYNQWINDYDNYSSGYSPTPDHYLKKALLGYFIMSDFANLKLDCMSDPFLQIADPRVDYNKRCHLIAEIYFMPLYEYFNENIQHVSSVLYLLDKYKHRTEWFHKEKLYKMYIDDTRRGEDNLTLDLQEYLHNQGIDYPFSSPRSPSGRADLIGQLETPDPMVLEVKIFNLENNYNKTYIRKGLTQAYRYALDYQKPVGYLVVYNLDERDLVFEKNEGSLQYKSIRIGDKTIFVLVIDIYPSPKTASERQKPLPYVIEDSYLLNLNEEQE
ncbi:hypothetical protein [Paenibacillus oleatilyticus]|uniref:Uncharacterized protein n=1 Tax=Paenibacillus oleatilyticus TaxID=2594886 RepID=A0ABV4UZH6_9BACL